MLAEWHSCAFLVQHVWPDSRLLKEFLRRKTEFLQLHSGKSYPYRIDALHRSSHRKTKGPLGRAPNFRALLMARLINELTVHINDNERQKHEYLPAGILRSVRSRATSDRLAEPSRRRLAMNIHCVTARYADGSRRSL